MLIMGCLIEKFEKYYLGVFDIYVGEKCVKIYVMLFKILKNVFKLTYQTPLCLKSINFDTIFTKNKKN